MVQLEQMRSLLLTKIILGVANYGARTTVDTSTLDIITVTKTDNDTVSLAGMQTAANYDAFTATVTGGGNIVELLLLPVQARMVPSV